MEYRFRYIAACIGLLLSVFAYIILQKSSVTFHLKQAVPYRPDLVFKFLKDPSYLIDINHHVRAVSLNDLRVDDLDVEYRHYSVLEVYPHVGAQNVTVSSIADPNDFMIMLHSYVFLGILKANVTYTFTGTNESSACLVTALCTIEFPWILRKFANRTSVETFTDMLSNLETVIDLTLKSDEH